MGGFLLIGLFGPQLPVSYLPVFGYGALVLCGFLGGLMFAQHRAKQVGLDPELFVDLSFWLLVSGVGGARLAYLVQYRDQLFAEVRSPFEALFAVINLANGGLVLIGGLVGGTVGFFAFCARRRLNSMLIADVITPSVFIGIGFGRIGCLLNGCCFGDRCELPWGIVFPAGSTTFDTLVARGFVDPAASGTFPLHPTQIYSSINGFILAVVTAHYFWYRRRHGDVFALGLILYPIARFMLETIRADEMGQLGTGLTISQLYCLGILTAGIILLIRLQFKPVQSVPA
jgi:phosphatidylglycerol:prolipoprotein diacylglycerol transferase